MDCIILSVVCSLTLGCCAYFFRPEILQIYTREPDVIHAGMEIMTFATVPYFLCGLMDLFPGGASWNGAFRSAYDPVHHRCCGNQNRMDLWNLSIPQISVRAVYFLPCILDPYHTDAGMLLLLCEKESTWENEDLCIDIKNEKALPFRIYSVGDVFCRSFFNRIK